MNHKQIFADPGTVEWIQVDFLPGVQIMPFAQPAPEGSIHRTKLVAGTVIPAHTHPGDEYVLVLSGSIETGGRHCAVGTFWTTPARLRQGPHVAITDAELLTIRLGPLGLFDAT